VRNSWQFIRALQLRDHLVESLGQVGHLVVAAHCDAGAQVAGGQSLSRLHDVGQGGGDTMRDDGTAQERHPADDEADKRQSTQ
jgi:hypothetical protein